MYRRRLVRIAVLATAAAAFLATSAEASPPTTVVVTPDPIKDLIVAEGKAAWCSQIVEDYLVTGEMWVQNLRTGARVQLDSLGGADEGFWSAGLLAFDGDRAVWRETYEDVHSDWESYVTTDALSDRHQASLGDLYNAYDWIIEPDGTPLLYGTTQGLTRVEGRKGHDISSIPAIKRFSATKSRIVTVRSQTGEVELRRLPGGKLVRTIPVDGSARAVSLTPRLVTVLVAKGGNLRLARYRLSGKLLGSTAVPPRTRARLDADGKWVVFSAGARIFVLNGETGEVTRLRTLSFPPGELQASGGHVYWAANWGGHGHVRSLSLPAG